MPSNRYEGIIELFRGRPALAAELLDEVFGLKMPDYTVARVESEDRTEAIPTEYRADAVVTLDDYRRKGRDRRSMTVVIEVQRGRDPGKHWSRPVYLTTLRARAR